MLGQKNDKEVGDASPKDDGKKNAKEVGTDGDKKKTTRRRKKQPAMPYAVPIHRVLKQINPEGKIMRSTVVVLDAFFQDMYDKITMEIAHLMQYAKHRAVMVNDVEAAVRLVLPGELAVNAVTEGRKAVYNYGVFMKTKKADQEAKKKAKEDAEMQVDAGGTQDSITIDGIA